MYRQRKAILILVLAAAGLAGAVRAQTVLNVYGPGLSMAEFAAAQRAAANPEPLR